MRVLALTGRSVSERTQSLRNSSTEKALGALKLRRILAPFRIPICLDDILDLSAQIVLIAYFARSSRAFQLNSLHTPVSIVNGQSLSGRAFPASLLPIFLNKLPYQPPVVLSSLVFAKQKVPANHCYPDLTTEPGSEERTSGLPCRSVLQETDWPPGTTWWAGRSFIGKAMPGSARLFLRREVLLGLFSTN